MTCLSWLSSSNLHSLSFLSASRRSLSKLILPEKGTEITDLCHNQRTTCAAVCFIAEYVLYKYTSQHVMCVVFFSVTKLNSHSNMDRNHQIYQNWLVLLLLVLQPNDKKNLLLWISSSSRRRASSSSRNRCSASERFSRKLRISEYVWQQHWHGRLAVGAADNSGISHDPPLVL